MLKASPFPYEAPAKSLPEDGVDTLFCSINCMKNPVKYIEYSRVEYKYHPINLNIKAIDYSTEKVLSKASDYYSKESNDVAILIDFITRINKDYNQEFNLTMDNIKILLENNGGFFLLKKEEVEGGIIKNKIQLKPIELKTI